MKHEDDEGPRMRRVAKATAIIAACLLAALASPAAQENEAILNRIDAAARARFDHVLGFTDTEHYAVFRGAAQAQPAAEMTVKTTYRKGVGKSYAILRQSGSALIQKFGLHPLLDNEKEINEPGKVENSWFTTANYEMKVKPGGEQTIDGRACVAVTMKPRRKAPNMIDGTLWVDAADGSIVRVEGVASRSPSLFAGTTHMMRSYTTIDGYAMAQHARAESDSALFGRTVVTIDYSDYHLEVRSAP